MSTFSQLSILVIHDQRAGHLNPSLGICDALEPHFQVNLTLQNTPKIAKWQISLLKKLSWYPRLYALFAQCFFQQQVSQSKFDAIVCSGMPNLLYALHLKNQQNNHMQQNTALYYAGDVRKLNPAAIDCCITALPQKIATPQLILPTPPVRGNITQLQQQPSEKSTALLLLGGATDEHPFAIDDFKHMVQQFVKLCQSQQLKGLISSSRRTPALDQLWQDLAQQPEIELHLWGQSNAQPLVQLMQRATAVFVTEDSTTMLAEAIQSGRFVSSLFCTGSRLESLNQKYLEQGMMQRQNLQDDFTWPAQRNLSSLNAQAQIVDLFAQIQTAKQSIL